jgi:hypothetical protein
LKLAFHESEYDKMSTEDHKVLHLITAMVDPKLREDLIKIKAPLTLVKVEDHINAYEEAKATSSKIGGDITRYTSNYRGGGRGRGTYRGRGATNAPGAYENPGRITYCNCCNKPGHVAHDCYT